MSRTTQTVIGLLTVTLLLAGCSGNASKRATPETTQAGQPSWPPRSAATTWPPATKPGSWSA